MSLQSFLFYIFAGFCFTFTMGAVISHSIATALAAIASALMCIACSKAATSTTPTERSS